MKQKLLIGWLCLCLVIGLAPSALAGDPSQVVALKLNSSWCVVGTQTLLVDAQNREVVPISEDGRTLVPIRLVLEAFGGQVGYSAETGRVSCTLGTAQVELAAGSDIAWVNGAEVKLDVPAKTINSRTFVPVRFVSERLGLSVAYEETSQIVVISNQSLDQAALATLPAVKQLSAKTAATGEPVVLKSGAYAVPSGTVKANIITVNMGDPRVSVKMEMVDNKLGATRAFSSIVASSGAAAVINGNFFESYQQIKEPIGHVMSNGVWLYGNSGISSLGITADNQMRYGNPPLFVRIKTSDSGKAQEWSAYSVNILQQGTNDSVLYTPARGQSVPVTCNGKALTVENCVTTGYRAVSAGESLSIPRNGFVLYMGDAFAATHYYQTPELGRTVVQEPYLRVPDDEGFTLAGVQAVISGAPRLVKDGAMVTVLDSGFTDARFTGQVSPRTAVGTTADGKLLLVNSSGASIQQLRELMLQLGCVDAINVDGGGSAAMYYKGDYLATPGRELTTTLQVFVNG